VNRRVYLDYNATTPVDPRVLEVMLPHFSDRFGNAASTHSVGRAANAAVDRARDQVAWMLGASAGEVYFTSGATESINLAIKGSVLGRDGARSRVVTVATEHKAVLDGCRASGELGADVIVIGVGRDGLIDLAELRAAIDDSTLLVSVMAANNETGVIQPIAAISELAHKQGALFHCDATQAVGKVPLSMHDVGIDLVSMSAHKIYGPQGVGVLAATPSAASRLRPLVHGGGHERGLRSGTLNVPGIAGLGAAAEIAATELVAESRRLEDLRAGLERAVLGTIPGATINGADAPRLPSTTNVRFSGAEADVVMLLMPGVSVSSGSACTAASPAPSHVMLAMGLDYAAAQECIRFSLGRPTTPEEIAAVVSLLGPAVQQARAEGLPR
jgi:cysteine desulfurase